MVTSQAINLPAQLRVNPEQFGQFTQANPELRMELTAQGKIIVMSPTGSEGGSRNAEASADIVIWNRQTGLGKVFDSSSGFQLPNGAIRSPDTAWIAKGRWDALTPEQRRGFAPICPDFVLELASESDAVSVLQSKMREYVENGARLGWLIVPKAGWAEIYRGDQSVERLDKPKTLSGETVLPGFLFPVETIFWS
ncbi:Uma2 family endonuclease [Leptothoe kymatousa]|uniref:Uma2 family endonuclease n=1 Tax=Leptothoe kymatousa TAU-MAC 1615 TaxID=2364775 RepID=A0ABS5Y2S7_9CYAN|nr:Uma2 family endonuclease [Leptothoe kymatousa]MBT9311669.1 Uma2 family endonuclease [Leptothoe kymatousa TAU-MAC 1615]